MDFNSNSTGNQSLLIRRPQEESLGSPWSSSKMAGGAVRHLPPSSSSVMDYRYQTPSNNKVRRSQSQRSSRSLNSSGQHFHPSYPNVNYDSPFVSPPPTVTGKGESQSARSTRTAIPTQKYPYQTLAFDSPFQSPPPTALIQRRQQHETRPQPLVLDPSGSGRSPRQSNASSDAIFPHTPSKSLFTTSSKQPRSGGSTVSSSNTASDIAQQFLDVAARRIRDQPPSASLLGGAVHYHTTPAVDGAHQESAASLARVSTKAGFLQKLGQNIPEFKRRFFLLKAETCLYYYLSPNDTEPRGKYSLEGADIQTMEHLPDGRCRFGILLADNSSDSLGASDEQSRGSRRHIVLEARSSELGEEWMDLLQKEQVTSLKAEMERLTSQSQSQKARIQDLERQVEDFKLVEKDRDGALEDARQWKDQFERLDEALRLLTQRMRKPPVITTTSKPKKLVEDPDEPGASRRMMDDGYVEEKKETDFLQTPHQSMVVAEMDALNVSETRITSKSGHDDDTPTKNNMSSRKIRLNKKEDSECALLDTAQVNDDDNYDNLDEILSVPGTYFSSLANACQRQRESLRLAAEEAASSVEDVQEAQAQVESMKERMNRAEKHLTKLWEENCSIRKTLKQKKREKRVLVREYKALQQTKKELEETAATMTAKMNAFHHTIPPTREIPTRTITEEEEDDEAENLEQDSEHKSLKEALAGSDEERLIIELEEHVASSIRLHERLLAANDFEIDFENEGDLNTSIEGSEMIIDDLSNYGSTSTSLQIGSNASIDEVVERQSPLQPTALQPRLMSLIDENESEPETEDEEAGNGDGYPISDDDEDDDEDDDVGVNEYQPMSPMSPISPSVVSSVGAEFGSVGDFSQHSMREIPRDVSTHSTPERPNPVLQLDKDDEDDVFGIQRQHSGNVCGSTTSSALNAMVTESGQATSRLTCPLVDVVDPKGPSKTPSEANAGLRVYHLTFYSKKIGIQFQKAPPAPTKPKGLLSAAFTADLTGEPDGSDKTAAELRNVATISSLAGGRRTRNEEICPVAVPKDAVLVCGFEGFDESGTNQKPKLGARLVAFDGISVEIGPWTFDSIRKAIKMRKRPLTLSFRNDFLTTDQRAVLTKAVMEVDAKCPPPRPTIPYGSRPPSTTPSVNSAHSHETEYFVNGNDAFKPIFEVPDQDLSAWAQQEDCCHEKLSAATNSVSTQYGRLRRLSSSSHSHSTHQSNFRSFSEAGSSITSSIAPLVANLVKGVSDRKREEAEFAPQYMSRADSLENRPQHQDFQSNLL